MKIHKIKVTKYAIRTYSVNNDIREFSFTQNFLDGLLKPEGRFSVISSNKNVTWYERNKGTERTLKTTEATPTTTGTPDDDTPTVDRLISEGYDLTDSAKSIIKNSSLTFEEVTEGIEGLKVTLWNVKKLIAENEA